jgi:hypothetical protein
MTGAPEAAAIPKERGTATRNTTRDAGTSQRSPEVRAAGKGIRFAVPFAVPGGEIGSVAAGEGIFSPWLVWRVLAHAIDAASTAARVSVVRNNTCDPP